MVTQIKVFCALVVILGPFLFSLISSVLKVKFRLELRGQVEMIYEVLYVCISLSILDRSGHYYPMGVVMMVFHFSYDVIFRYRE